MEKKEVEFKILRDGTACPTQLAKEVHHFEYIKEEKIIFCKDCGLFIKYGEREDKNPQVVK